MSYKILLTYNLEDAKENQHYEFKKAMIDLGWEAAETNTTLIGSGYGSASDMETKIYTDIKKVQKEVGLTIKITYGLCVHTPKSDTFIVDESLFDFK